MTSPVSYPPAIGVSGKSGSGKTLLIERLIPRLERRGLRVGVIKHCSHRLDVDCAGKDSDRLFSAGAEVLTAGPTEAFTRFHQPDMRLSEAVDRVADGCDLCLIEGYGSEDIPRILVGSSKDAPGKENILLTVSDVERQVGQAETAICDVLARAHWGIPTWGLVLVGGDSRRMGRPKSLLKDNNGFVLESLTEVLEPVSDGVLVAGDGPLPERLADLPRLLDVPSATGPMAGLLSGMRWRPATRWIAVACDLPLVNEAAVEWLLSQTDIGKDAVMPRLAYDARCEPLFAVYEPTSRAYLERRASEGRWSLRKAFDAERVSNPIIPGPLRKAWTNVNTPEEWAAIRSEGPTGNGD